MTEQEAIEIINGIEEVRGNLPEDGNDVEIALMMAKGALEEIQQYRAIGTVEECQEAVEKLRAKKPKTILRHRGGFEMEHCPNCDMDYQVDRRYTVNDDYCPSCGKLLDSAFKSFCGNCGQAIKVVKAGGVNE